jgi:hypothetical protein
MTQDYTLTYGTHASPDEGRCAMEWVSHLAGEPHSDAPRCVSPVLRALCISLNDGLADRPRQRLRPYLTRTIGTAGDGLDEARAWLAMDWLVRTYTPAWLRVAGLADAAQRLADRAPIIDDRSLDGALGALGQARREARRARVETFAGGGMAGRAAGIAGGRNGREAAWACAGAAAWAAARVALGEQAGDRARAIARAAAGDAAAVAVRRVRDDTVCGPATALDARRTALRPTLEALADSALDLLQRMLPTQVGDRQVGDREPHASHSDRDLQAMLSDLETVQLVVSGRTGAAPRHDGAALTGARMGAVG